MKNDKTYFEKKRNSIHKIFASIFFFLFAMVLPATAQAEDNAPAVLFENPLIYLYIVIFVLIGVVAYSIFNAKRVLEQNGKSMDVPLPSLRWMAGHGKVVAVFFLLIVLSAIIWALKF